ncbi:B12-binding domain-containing radical SAM protein [candidate division FCPU426 bacterium]|nr:B12-binding domain-containing radical SAM protein [candidate division FCPU426 bacterium]
MKILLVYPRHPETFWSFKYALRFIGKKSAFPPLGLLTIANMLPEHWQLKLVDMNVQKLPEKDLQWADYVFISATSIQRNSVLQIVEQCQKAGVKIVAGGPLFTTAHSDFSGIDHFILNEAEITLPQFVHDLQQGNPRQVYTSDQLAELSQTPVPRWELIPKNKYGAMSIQYSRGCPFNCDFCDITLLYGHKTRVKSKAQIILELDQLYANHWRGSVFFVDDNFIGNKTRLKNEVLPAITEWMKKHRYPFTFLTQASVNLADDDELLKMMVNAGFDTVFVGIESPNEASLTECLKSQNTKRDLIHAIKKCQQAGLQIQGGFIVGFDSDPLTIFDQHIRFIQQSGITTAMVGLLNALKGTGLFQRLEKEHRMLRTSTGDNTDCSINFVPKMDVQVLIEGYKKIIKQIYSPANYYKRAFTFLKQFNMPRIRPFKLQFNLLLAFFRSTVRLGIIGRERFYYWKLVLWTLFNRPVSFPIAINLAINGFHFRKVFKHTCL